MVDMVVTSIESGEADREIPDEWVAQKALKESMTRKKEVAEFLLKNKEQRRILQLEFQTLNDELLQINNSIREQKEAERASIALEKEEKKKAKEALKTDPNYVITQRIKRQEYGLNYYVENRGDIVSNVLAHRMRKRLENNPEYQAKNGRPKKLITLP